MRLTMCLSLAGAALLPSVGLAQATFQPPPPPPVISAASAPLRAASAAPARAASAPISGSIQDRPHLRVIEDDEVRIEEVRVRGQTRRITVQSKVAGAKPYEIIVPAGGKDYSQDRGAAGQRAWSLLEF